MPSKKFVFPLLLSIIVSTLHAQKTAPVACSICLTNNQISAEKANDVYTLYIDKKTIPIGTKLKQEEAAKKFTAALNQELSKLWNSEHYSASAYTAFVTKFVRDALSTFYSPAPLVPTLIDSIQINPSTYIGLVKGTDNNYVISVYAENATTDVFTHEANGYEFKLNLFENNSVLQNALPAILFLKNRIAGIKRPDLVLERKTGDTLIELVANGNPVKTKIVVDKSLPHEISLATTIGPAYRAHLLNRQNYVESIREKLNPGCSGCKLSDKETLLVYDHECKQFLYKPLGSDELRELDDLSFLHVQYKRAFRVKIVNFNRYIFNLNLASSDISLTSQESGLMQQYFLAGTTNGQPNPANTYTNNGSSNGADYVFGNIANFKANIDLILTKIKVVTMPVVSTQLLQNLSTAIAVSAVMFGNASLAGANNTLAAIGFIQSVQTQPHFTFDGALVDKYLQSINNISDFMKTHPNMALGAAKTILPQNGGNLDQRAKDTVKTFIDSAAILKAQAPYLKAQAEYLEEANRLKERFYHLREYCDSFIDNRITAYSLCTGDFPCCETPLQTYAHFESLLTDVSNQLFSFKQARNIYVLAGKQIPAKPATPPPAKNTGETTQPGHIVLDVAASDLVVSSGRITGLTLHQLADTTKPKKAADTTDPSDMIDTLWYTFEKSIPTDYIMRQISFRNNMIRQNISFPSDPIFPTGDRLGLVIQTSVADTVKRMGTMPASTSAFSADIPVFGKALFSFSAGSFIGFGVRKPTYEWQQIPTPGSNIVQQNSPYRLAPTGPGAYPAGLDGMANVTWRQRWFPHWRGFTNNVWAGVSGGVGVVVDQPTIRLGYLLGGVLSIGTYQQFHISAGAMAMNVNVLKDDLNTSQVYQTQPAIQQYNQKLQLGAFFSVSYTVFMPKSTGTMQNQVINGN